MIVVNLIKNIGMPFWQILLMPVAVCHEVNGVAVPFVEHNRHEHAG